MQDPLFPMFKGAARIPAPWPVHARLKSTPKFDHDTVAQVLASPAVLTQIDPGELAANQPWILAEHVAYYLGDTWLLTGRTSADRGEPMNRFPLVLPDYLGRLTIVAGHHRAAAARLRGEQLLARVAPGLPQQPAALTPSLALAPGSDGVAETEVLRRRGLDEAEIRFAFAVARPARGAVSEHPVSVPDLP